jgi:conjugative transfer region protein TrbK
VSAKLIYLGALVAVALTACDRRPAEVPAAATPPRTASVVPSVDVARLTADRRALDDAHARCKARAPDATPKLCAAAAEATRRRFLGKARTYAPAPVQPFPSEPR